MAPSERGPHLRVELSVGPSSYDPSDCAPSIMGGRCSTDLPSSDRFSLVPLVDRRTPVDHRINIGPRDCLAKAVAMRSCQPFVQGEAVGDLSD